MTAETAIGAVVAAVTLALLAAPAGAAQPATAVGPAAPPTAPATEATPGGLPRVAIATQRRIRDEPRTRARLRVAGDYDGWSGIELRGQSSQTFAKKSYAVELRERGGAEREAALLGMPADDDWILYAAYNDKTLMRNVVAYETARRMGRWAAQTRFVELWLNGRYEGVYVLMERIELNAARVDVPGNGLTGKYLLELTFPFQAKTKGAHFTTPVTRRPIVYEEPERKDLSGREARYIRGVVSRAERSLYSSRRAAWRSHLDAGAAVDHVLLQELFRNVDAFHASTYLVKAAGRKLALGPIWDLDLAMGNSTFASSRFVRGWWTRDRDWAAGMWRDPAFRRDLGRRWRELRAQGLHAAVLASVDAGAAVLGPVAGRNFRRWPVLNRRVYQNPHARGSFTAEVRFLRSWLSRRMAWLDRATRP
jgi:hypothetical protein